MTPSPDEVAERLAFIRSVGVDALEAPDVVWLVDQLERVTEQLVEAEHGNDVWQQMDQEKAASLTEARKAQVRAESELDRVMAERDERGRQWDLDVRERERRLDAALSQVKTLRGLLEKAFPKSRGCMRAAVVGPVHPSLVSEIDAALAATAPKEGER